MLMTRGVLLDIARLKGVEVLPEDYEISTDDLQQALADASLSLEPGDAVIIHTGWGQLWENRRSTVPSAGRRVSA